MSETSIGRATAAQQYVLPSPPRSAPTVPTAAPGRSYLPQRHAEAASMLGKRMATMSGCQEQFLGELRTRLLHLDEAIAEAPRAQLKGALRGVLEVLDWCDEVQAQMAKEAEFAGQGWMPLDLGTLCSSLAQELPEVLAAPAGRTAWWGDGRLVDELLRSAITLLHERMGGKGRVLLEATESPAGPVLSLQGSGDAIDAVEPGSADRFRRLADRLGARVQPGPLGVGSAALTIYLPNLAG